MAKKKKSKLKKEAGEMLERDILHPLFKRLEKEFDLVFRKIDRSSKYDALTDLELVRKVRAVFKLI